jgi:choline dehydrogenase
MTEKSSGVDVIVVGAGSAGCATTRRLVDAGLRVLLLEAGGADTNPAIHDPLRFGELWFGPENWGYRTAAQKHAAGRRLPWPRGKVLGGSSALNAMIFVRGAPADFDHWAYLGNTGWSWRDVLPVYRQLEDFDGGASHSRGSGGPLPVLSGYQPDPIHESLVVGAKELGLPFNPDYNSGELDGVSFVQLNVKDGRRQSAATSYLHPIIGQPALTVLTGAHARRLLLDGSRCVGVEWERDGRVESARAEVEVIVSAGTIESPRLLMLSGLGDADHLRSVGIDVVAHLPGVGRNLHDHLLAPVIFGAERPLGRPSAGLPPAQTHLFWRSQSGLPVPDVQPLHFPVPLYEPWMQGPANGFTLQAGAVRPVSRGTIRLTGADPHDELVIDPATFRCDTDLRSLESAVTLCRELGATSALAAGWGAHELYPGPDVRTAAELRDYVRRSAGTYHHQVGTCKMGVDAEAVVDPRLRVHGITGLRVADASIMPAITTGNTNAPAILIGERVAAFALADHR